MGRTPAASSRKSAGRPSAHRRSASSADRSSSGCPLGTRLRKAPGSRFCPPWCRSWLASSSRSTRPRTPTPRSRSWAGHRPAPPSHRRWPRCSQCVCGTWTRQPRSGWRSGSQPTAGAITPGWSRCPVRLTTTTSAPGWTPSSGRSLRSPREYATSPSTGPRGGGSPTADSTSSCTPGESSPPTDTARPTSTCPVRWLGSTCRTRPATPRAFGTRSSSTPPACCNACRTGSPDHCSATPSGPCWGTTPGRWRSSVRTGPTRHPWPPRSCSTSGSGGNTCALPARCRATATRSTRCGSSCTSPRTSSTGWTTLHPPSRGRMHSDCSRRQPDSSTTRRSAGGRPETGSPPALARIHVHRH